LEANRAIDKSKLTSFSVSALSTLTDQGVVGKELEQVSRIVYDNPLSTLEGKKENVILTNEQHEIRDENIL
jgi:hypothetical protein